MCIVGLIFKDRHFLERTDLFLLQITTAFHNFCEFKGPYFVEGFLHNLYPCFDIVFGVLLNRAPTTTQLHPPPLSSIHLHSAHFNLHPAPSTFTQLISDSTQLSATSSTMFEPKRRT